LKTRVSGFGVQVSGENKNKSKPFGREAAKQQRNQGKNFNSFFLFFLAALLLCDKKILPFIADRGRG
jgi:hypothetical protein